MLEPGMLASTVTERNMMIVLVVSAQPLSRQLLMGPTTRPYQGLVNIGAYSALILTQN